MRLSEKFNAVFQNIDSGIPGTFTLVVWNSLPYITVGHWPGPCWLNLFTQEVFIVYSQCVRHWNLFRHGFYCQDDGDEMYINNQEVERQIDLLVQKREGFLQSRTEQKASWRREHLSQTLIRGEGIEQPEVGVRRRSPKRREAHPK